MQVLSGRGKLEELRIDWLESDCGDGAGRAPALRLIGKTFGITRGSGFSDRRFAPEVLFCICSDEVQPAKVAKRPLLPGSKNGNIVLLDWN